MGNNLAEFFHSFVPEPVPIRKQVSYSSSRNTMSVSVESYAREEDDFGWFEDTEPALRGHDIDRQPLHKALSNPPPVTEAPSYILESNLETQQLWYVTAGQRPQQPRREREYFETLWLSNFQESAVDYLRSPQNSQDAVPKTEFPGEIIFRGESLFSNSVSKTFGDDSIQSLTIQVPQYRVMETKQKEQYAEFLVLISISSLSTITFGVWRRHSEFEKLATLLANSSHSSSVFKNTLLSWQCMMQRKKWYKCLDKDYLSLKCFLMERFMHDMLFESQSPEVMINFLGLNAVGTTDSSNNNGGGGAAEA